MTSTSNYYDLRVTCRSCLQKTKKLCPLDCQPNYISRKTNSMRKTKTPAELMMACTNVEIASDDGLPQNVCMKCISALKAAFAYKTMCEESDKKLRSVLREHLSRVKVKIERCDDRRDAEQESKIDTDNYPFEVNWFPQMNAEITEVESILKEKKIDLDSTEVDLKTVSPVAHTAIGAESIDGNSVGFDSLDAWDDHCDHDFKINENETLNDVSGESPIRKVRSGQGSKEKSKKEKNFLCEFCSGTFYSIGQLTIHYVTHTKRKDFICDICKRQYSTKACLKDHMRYHGDKSKLYSHLCTHCGKGFAYKKLLSEHMNVHTGERPYQCDICNKTYQTRQNLRIHKKRHDPVKRYTCKTCGKGFIKNNKLTIHMRTHTGERPYICKICDRAFSQNSTLRAHMRIHTGEKLYYCNICDERFIQNYELVGHRRKNGHWLPGTEPPPKIPKPVRSGANRKKRTPKPRMKPLPDIEPFVPNIEANQLH